MQHILHFFGVVKDSNPSNALENKMTAKNHPNFRKLNLISEGVSNNELASAIHFFGKTKKLRDIFLSTIHIFTIFNKFSLNNIEHQRILFYVSLDFSHKLLKF